MFILAIVSCVLAGQTDTRKNIHNPIVDVRPAAYPGQAPKGFMQSSAWGCEETIDPSDFVLCFIFTTVMEYLNPFLNLLIWLYLWAIIDSMKWLQLEGDELKLKQAWCIYWSVMHTWHNQALQAPYLTSYTL